MPLHTIHRLQFNPTTFDFGALQSSAGQKIFVAIEPISAHVLRVTLEIPTAHGVHFVASRTAQYVDVFPQDCYRWWVVEPSERSDGLLLEILRASSVVITTSEEVGCLLKLPDGAIHHLARLERPMLLYGDPRRLCLEGDLAFEVDAKSFIDAVGMLRGRGGSVASSVMIDVAIHQALPVRHNGEHLGHVRVLTLKRMDNQARVDVVAKCSPMLLESKGLRFSLASLAANIHGIRGITTSESDRLDIISVGFDLDDRVVWVGRSDDACAAYFWKQDMAMQAITAKPATL